MSKNVTRVLVLSDTHCGNVVGLTPPEMDSLPGDGLPEELSAYNFRRWHWDQYTAALKSIGTVDIVIANGDLVDGPGHKTKGTEQIEVDRIKQADMAVSVLKAVRGKPTFYQSFGTGYHTGDVEDWELLVSKEIGSYIDAEHNLEIRGTHINYRHHASGSQIPHGRATAPAREKLWKDMWALRGEYPQINVILRSHVHYYGGAFGYDAEPWVSLTTPALQGYGSKYARRLSGTVDMGFLVFEFRDDGKFSHYPLIWRRPFKPAEEAGS